MNDQGGLRDLYQEVILDHNRRPRNFGTLPSANHQAEGYNPLCGDKVTVFLDLEDDGRIRDVAFQGAGCAISTASASLMTEALKGKTAEEARELFQGFQGLVTKGTGEDSEELGKLTVFAGVREFPMRVKCATLAWHTLLAALDEKSLDEQGRPVSTE
ncbi:MAG TPA: SUF system NifU family Fe-S cluster assembly protein [Thermoanaerobaculia bacterium]|jgi:nitrogen fixation NifU-like protein|nr:SUF system NifU family Fe-S cluster assembly protein [Thermoanaerobaculia bacterium]